MARAKKKKTSRKAGRPAARPRRRRARGSSALAQLAFEALAIEGGLLSPDWLARAAQLEAGGQSEADYRIPKGLNLRDEIGRYWRIAQALWSDLSSGREAAASDELQLRALAERFVTTLLRDCFGFASITKVEPAELDERLYPIGHAALEGRVPVVIAPAGRGLDALSPSFGDGTRRRSAFGLCQEFLNAEDGALWGLASDGERLRILRDNASLTRPAWIEADLGRIFTEERYADFAALWLLAHETRFGRPAPQGTIAQPVTECSLEAWREAGREEGTRARQQLRHGVEEALAALGQGFLAHADNQSLRAALSSGALTKEAYFQELLRLAYRLIFLLTVEERGVLHPDPAEAESNEAARKLYAEGYGLRRLRERAVKRSAHDRHHDHWETVKIVFRGLADGEPRLALPALAGIFAKDQCPTLDGARLENRFLLLALFRLSWLREDAGLARVNWRDMGPEELGSVYESLLELVPQITEGGRAFSFATGAETKGHARKTTGSYYTPDSLVQVLLDSALEPVVDRTIAEHPSDAVEALLSLSVVDPACGSGHFLLAAARRLAAHVARLQADGTPSAAEYRHALRQVVGRCIYGVDLNPMAVELCKVSLWMEAVEPGLPLTFLDSHIRHGNALLGTNPELMDKGIPDDAWKPIEGDDKKVASALKKRNKESAQGQRGLDTLWSKPKVDEADELRKAIAALESAPDVDAAALAAKESRWQELLDSKAYQHQKLVADAWCAAFVWPKQPGPLAEAAPTNELWRQIRDGQGHPPELTVKTVNELAEQYTFFHWHLAFPQVFGRGGFDVVLGNPPWERLKIQEKEWFASRSPEIASAKNAAERRRLIAALALASDPLFNEYAAELRASQATPQLLRTSGMYPLCGLGRDINTAAVFLERMVSTASRLGRVGCITPASTMLGDTTKDFVAALLINGQLRKHLHFENEAMVFAGVHHAFRFSLVILAGSGGGSDEAEFVYYARTVTDLQDPDRRFSLSPDEVFSLNPLTRTLSAFRTARDAQLALDVCKRVPVADVSAQQNGGWNLLTRPGHYHMANDSEEFIVTDPTVEPIDTVVLYESKMLTAFDHRFGTYQGQTEAQANQGKLPETDDQWHADPLNTPAARYRVRRDAYRERCKPPWNRPWALVLREITSASSERTTIAAFLPEVATGHTLLLALSPQRSTAEHMCLAANLNSFVLDYFARQKVVGTHLLPSVLRQLPLLAPGSHAAAAPLAFAPESGRWAERRALELSYTAWDLEPFARDVGYDGPPFRWDPERRFLLRAELDAAFFHLYGIERDDVDYIMETFPIVRKNDEKAHGEYRTKRVILEIYDEMAEAARTGKPYQTRLDPPPADPHVAHPPVAPALPTMPAIIPQLPPPEEAAIVICSLLHAAGGTLTRTELARAFALRARPELLKRLAPASLAVAGEWSTKVGTRSVAQGLLAATLKTLSDRDGVTLSTNADSRSTVSTSPNTPAEEQIDRWFHFEAHLALRVLRAQPAEAFDAIDNSLSGDDRALLELAS